MLKGRNTINKEKWKKIVGVILICGAIILFVGAGLMKLFAITAGFWILIYDLGEMIVNGYYKEAMYLFSFLAVAYLFLILITPKEKQKANKKGKGKRKKRKKGK